MEQIHFHFYKQRVYVAKIIGERVVFPMPRKEMPLAEERSLMDFDMVKLVQVDYDYPARCVASTSPLGNACRKAYSSGGNIFAAMPSKGLAICLRTEDKKLLEDLERFGKVLTPRETF